MTGRSDDDTAPLKTTTAKAKSPLKTTTKRVECNYPPCTADPTTRGLCDLHWATQRSYATPKTTKGSTGV